MCKTPRDGQGPEGRLADPREVARPIRIVGQEDAQPGTRQSLAETGHALHREDAKVCVPIKP